jgi:integrase
LDDIRLGKTKRGKDISKNLISDENALKIHVALLPEKDTEKPWHYWIFMLCLFQGARPHEICQLDTSDVASDSKGIPCIAICEEEEDDTKKIKNVDSMRIIPIHPFILEQGFLDYVEARRKDNAKKLFSLGKRHKKNGYTQTVAKFYSPLIKKKLGLPYSLKHTRKTFETKLNIMDLSNLENKIAYRITGRSIKVDGVPASVTQVVWENYILKDYPPSMMLSVLEKIKYTHEGETIG